MTATCPDPDTLRGVLDSSLPTGEYAEVVSHLDACPDCQERLEQMAAGGSSVAELAHSAKTDERPAAGSAFWPALRRVEREIQSPAHALLVTQADPQTRPSAERSYPFLEPADDPAHLGRIDRFQVVELVGRGGMGMVFRVFDACLQRTVAIKVLDPQYAQNELARSRFLREARAAAGLAHENVVIIHHVECVEARDLSFIVMQFVRGRSLQDRLDEEGPLPIREAVRVAAATASGLAAAHANGLIHRDIKPANILLEGGSGRVLLTDFGLARLNEDVKLTQTGFVAGTPLYMSPEQAHGEEVDHRSDLFSLGSVLYAMLTGGPPFQGSSPFAVLKQVTDGRARPVQTVNPAVPAAVAEIVDRLLEKNPRHRYAGAAEVAAALNEELAKLPPETVVGLAGKRSSRSVPRYVRSWWRRHSPTLFGTCAVLVGLLFIAEAAGLTRWTVLGQRGGPKAEPVLSRTSPAAAEPDTPPVHVLAHGDGAVWAVAFDRAGELIATASEGGTIKFWDARTGQARGDVLAKSPVWGIAFSPDGSRLAAATDDGFVRLWDVRTKEEVGAAIRHTFTVRSVAFSPDGTKLATGTRNGAVQIWDAESGERIHGTAGHESGAAMSVAFSFDGSLLASAGSDKLVKVWRVADGTIQTTLSGHTGPVYAVAFHPSAAILASAGWDHTVRLWAPNATTQLKVIEAHPDDIWSVAFGPTGRTLVTGGQDRTAKWVDAETGSVNTVFRGPAAPVHAVAIGRTADGLRVAAGSRDGTVRVWALEP
jgi:eukaryotic-like serine/threonine-protein kinase